VYFTSEDFSLGMAGPELQEDLATDLDAEGQVSSRPVFKDGHRFQPPKFVGTNT